MNSPTQDRVEADLKAFTSTLSLRSYLEVPGWLEAMTPALAPFQQKDGDNA